MTYDLMDCYGPSALGGFDTLAKARDYALRLRDEVGLCQHFRIGAYIDGAWKALYESKIEATPAKYICKTGFIGHTIQCPDCNYHFIDKGYGCRTCPGCKITLELPYECRK